MKEKKKKKKRPLWLQKFLDEIPNSVLRDDGLRVRVSPKIETTGKKQQFEEFVGTPSPDNFSELKNKAADDLKVLKETVRLKKSGAFDELDKETLVTTTGDFLAKWLAAVSPTLGTRTRADYENVIKRYVKKPLGNVLLRQLTDSHIQKVCDALVKKGINRQARYVRQVLSTALNYAVEHTYLDSNPIRKVKLPKKKHTEIVALDSSQARAFINAARESDNGLIFEFALKTGMRPEEYLSLRWKDVDFENQAVFVRRKVVLTKTSEPVFEETKTKGSRRLIKIVDDSLLERLKIHQKAQKTHIEKFKKYKNLKYKNHQLVFASSTGTPIGLPNLLRRYFKPILEKAELENLGITVYSLRHTMATLLLLKGESPKVVSERLGHASVSITLDTYSHVLPSMQADASRKLTEMFD